MADDTTPLLTSLILPDIETGRQYRSSAYVLAGVQGGAVAVDHLTLRLDQPLARPGGGDAFEIRFTDRFDFTDGRAGLSSTMSTAATRPASIAWWRRRCTTAQAGCGTMTRTS